MRISGVGVTQIVSFLVTLGLGPTSGQLEEAREHDTCHLQTSIVPITRHLTATRNGRRIPVVCEGNLRLNKCAGRCESRVYPNVRTHSGFTSECRCCKETGTEVRQKNLTRCTNQRQEVPGLTTLIQVSEITGCACLRCDG